MEVSGETAAERRRYARLDIALTVDYVVRDAAGKITERATAQSSDVSAAGIRLMTPTRLRNGAWLDLEITIEGREGEPVRASGEVVWQHQLSDHSFETGAVIRYMDEDDKRRFFDFVFSQMAELVGMKPTYSLH